MREVIVILGAFLVGACTPNLSAYYYMSFVDIPDIKVLEYGKADYWPMFGHKEMPIRYELKRDGYTLLLSADTQHLGGKVEAMGGTAVFDDGGSFSGYEGGAHPVPACNFEASGCR